MKEEANASDCAAAVNAAGGKAIGLTCEVTDEAQVKAAVQRAVAELGRVDILVNNAAIFNQKGVLDMPLDAWRQQTDIILGGTFLFTKHAAQAMIDCGEGGVIVNIISTAGHQGEPGNIAYCTAKGGLLNFTKSTAMELARHGIRVVSLTPTATDPWEMFDRAGKWGRDMKRPEGMAALIDKFRKRIPMQPLPKPSDYGRALAFLVSDDAAMITGTDLRVDAGAVARYWAWDPAAES
ncbi:SDR family NAD(P)-dependent oxidoreductase [Croceicoccus sediminis]|uniref:SDR family NAD(P)-dependent oxidoreductase n=1 Tax=Croceicoccus sediminis TaxID=2571150 RepID=UPI001183C157|nr:SDR family oxidoreductase [Croceicoccus sediminis]